MVFTRNTHRPTRAGQKNDYLHSRLKTSMPRFFTLFGYKLGNATFFLMFNGSVSIICFLVKLNYFK